VLILLKLTCFGIWLLIMLIIIKAVYKKHKFPAQDFIWKLQDEAKHKCHGDGSSREII
jgi:hypothetical protein